MGSDLANTTPTDLTLPSDLEKALTLVVPGINWEEEAKTVKDLKINGVDDKAGYKIVKDNHVRLKKVLTTLREDKKNLKGTVDGWGKKILEDFKELESKLNSLIVPLEEKRKSIDEEIERIKNEEIEKEKKRIADRKKSVFEAGFKFNGVAYVVGEVEMEEMDVVELEDDEFNTVLERGKVAHKVIIEAEQKEADRIKKLEEENKKKDEEMAEMRKQLEAQKKPEPEPEEEKENIPEKEKVESENDPLSKIDPYVLKIAKACHSCISMFKLYHTGAGLPIWEDTSHWEILSYCHLIDSLSRIETDSALTVHNEWVSYMTENGWSYGDSLDEKEKKHPLLGDQELSRETCTMYHIINGISEALI